MFGGWEALWRKGQKKTNPRPSDVMTSVLVELLVELNLHILLRP